MKQLEQVYAPDLTPGTTRLEISGDEFHHLHRVRRFQPGQQLAVVNGKGLCAYTIIREITNDSAILEIEELKPGAGEAGRQIHLAMAILKGDHFTEAVEKCIELGVSSVQPLLCDHTIKKNINIERLNRVAITAMKQSRRSRLTEISAPLTFTEYCKALGGGRKLFAIDHFESIPMQSILQNLHKQEALTIFIGPEGGWSESEIDFAGRNDYTFAWLGPRRLRAETAAALAVGAVSSLQAPDA